MLEILFLLSELLVGAMEKSKNIEIIPSTRKSTSSFHAFWQGDAKKILAKWF